MGKYSDRVAPLIVGATLKMKDNPYYKGLWVITSKDKRYNLKYLGKQQAYIRRTKNDLRTEFEYIFDWEKP